jgi:hypothetical protein
MTKSSAHSAGNDTPHKPASPQPKQSPQPTQVEGEGSYTASRRYNEGVKKHVETEDTEGLAEAAREALEGEEGDELRDAEQRGKRGPKP